MPTYMLDGPRAKPPRYTIETPGVLVKEDSDRARRMVRRRIADGQMKGSFKMMSEFHGKKVTIAWWPEETSTKATKPTRRRRAKS